MGNNDILELKEDIKNLDKKLDKNEENMNKRFEKNEENINKFMSTTGEAINKISETIMDFKVILAKEYVEKEDLEKVETKLNDKIDQNNTSRKKDIKETNERVDKMEKSGSVSFNDILRYIFFIAVSSGATYLFVK